MKYLLILTCFSFFIGLSHAQDKKLNLSIKDILSLRKISDIRVSPDEMWVAYTVTSRDTVKDKEMSRIWMVSTSGGDPIPMTSEDYSASSPRWSPDNKCLSFLAAKEEKVKSQIWTLNRFGGEAQQLTHVKQGVSGYEWSPDGKRLLLVLKDPKTAEITSDSLDDVKPLPHVIDRIYFKEDYEGYLDRRRSHIYTFTPGDTATAQLTSGDYDDSEPAWSPDGKWIAFTSNRADNPDLSYDSNIWLVPADSAGKDLALRQVTTIPGSDQSPAWSPDGKKIAYVTAINEPVIPFATSHLSVIDIESGESRVLNAHIDRNVSKPRFSKDGQMIQFILEDSGEQQFASISANGTSFTRVIENELTVKDYTVNNSAYALIGYGDKPAEIYRLNNAQTIQLTKVNDPLMEGVRLGDFEKIQFDSKDGTTVEAFVVKPVDFDASVKYPLILWIHGGPMSQYTWDFEETTTSFLFAANGYVVILVNPRGSTGYGEDFCKAIFADWGNLDYDDVMSGVDYLISQGWIDPGKLGVGGWSYGGILTNYVITKTSRFKAAISGASLGIIRANFGHDQYIKWYNREFGMPWENIELWERLSPFNDVEKITTPTLWIGGAVDWNVPIVNSEQMYLAMKVLGKETQLVVYPDEHHSIKRPSFQKDQLKRYLEWFNGYLK